MVPISLGQVLVAAAMLVVGDTIWNHQHGQNLAGLADWTAHLGTSLLILNLLPQRWRRPILLPALVWSVLIDADHIPQRFFHTYVLTMGTPRPYTHSWATPAFFCLLALLWPGRRALFIGCAVGVALHLFRDLAEEPGSGVSLFWPFTKHVYTYGHGRYLQIMAVIFALNLIRLALARGGPIRAAARTGPAR
jgi:inner membrane protein